jgi:hypothetical protein
MTLFYGDRTFSGSREPGVRVDDLVWDTYYLRQSSAGDL